MALSNVMDMPSVLPWFLTPVNRYPSLRTKTNRVPGSIPSKPEPALRVGGLRDRPGTSPRLNTSAPTIGCPSEPTTRGRLEYGVGVDQHNLADVMSLAELASDS